jgi:hypothetical protein
MNYAVERVSDRQGLDDLREPWSDLLAGLPEAPIFQTWEWTNTWYQHREPGWELWVLAARDERGRLTGVAPWMLTHHRLGPVNVDRLAFVGSYLTYRAHMDIVARPEEKEAVFAASMKYLKGRQGAWDVLDLEALAGSSPVRWCLGETGGRIWQVEELICPYQTLPATWEAYEKERLSSEHRWEIRNRRRKIERDYPGQVTFRQVASQTELDGAMDGLAALHKKRWHGKGQGSSFDHPSFEGFQREISALGLERDWLRLYVLEVAGQPIAAEYAFRYGTTLFGYATAFDPDWGRYSPGQLIMAYTIQRAIAEGLRELDLGRGTFDYKFRWAGQQRQDTHVVLSATLPGHLWASSGVLFRGAKTLAHERMPDSVRERVNRMLKAR